MIIQLVTAFLPSRGLRIAAGIVTSLAGVFALGVVALATKPVDSAVDPLAFAALPLGAVALGGADVALIRVPGGTLTSKGKKLSASDTDGTQLLLEPDEHPAARPFKEALVADGIPFTSFAVDDAQAEYERLRALGVEFTQAPLEMQGITTAVLDDTCGNLIQIASTS